MNSATLLQFGGLVIASFSIAIATLWVLTWLDQRKIPMQKSLSSSDGDSLAFLFDDENLVDATPHAKLYLEATPVGSTDWNRLLAALRPTFPNMVEEISTLADRGQINLVAQQGSSRIQADWKNGLARICLIESSSDTSNVELDRPSFDAMEKELDTLRATAESAPFLVWRQRADGTITWANGTYLKLSQVCEPDLLVPVWPPSRLFDLSNSGYSGPEAHSQRVTTHIVGEAEPRWFECFETPLGNESLFTAVAADKVVKAETALRDFVQTLTKTFAHLTIGLAIFDKQRRLALFNPALTDLISLPIEFLSGRPTLLSVLDRLRETKMIPEPKDYKSWRQQLFELEVAAVNGTYEETWSLANGRTYRVTGRPHPDGAVAFLFEDISEEISLTRRFRAELETGQAVLDCLSEAMVVFSPGGESTLSNNAYGKLWGIESTALLGDFGILDATKIWSEQCAPSPVWGDAREFIGAVGERAEWVAEVRMRDGRSLSCRFTPISGGATLVGFSLDTVQIAGQPERLEEQPDLDVETISA